MQGTAAFRFCGTLRFAPIQNLRYSGQGTADMAVRKPKAGEHPSRQKDKKERAQSMCWRRRNRADLFARLPKTSKS